jgi:pimeloyl-ACP methyl ester carboxylesterase
MKRIILLSVLAAALVARAADEELPFAGKPVVGPNDGVPPPNPVTPTAEQLQAIQAKLAEFRAAIKALKEAKASDDLVVDAEAYGWVIENVVRVPDGFINAAAIGRCISVLDDGLRRAAEIKAGTAAWPKLKGRVNRAYRSAVDGTAQPYHLNIPASYDPAKPTALYVYLHGRSHDTPDLGLTWVGGNDGNAGGATQGELGAQAPAAGNGAGNGRGNGGGGPNYIRVEAFGRGNNSFRWAGETDVLEVIASVSKRYNIDPNRIILAGFSMGGAGGWQIGLHNADLFCGLEVDAGVIGNRLNLVDGLTPSQRAANVTYGIMIDHALNVFNTPLVGYAGANDAQLASSTSIREQLGREGFTIPRTSQYVFTGKDINAIFLANPGQGHSHATGETARIINEFTAANLKRGRAVPDHIRFITYTTRYNRDFWVTVDGLQQSFSRASVDAERSPGGTNYTIKTSNVSRLFLTDTSAADRITIDDEMLAVGPADTMLLVRDGGHWTWQSDAKTADTGLRKQHNLQGPINDAFFDAFLCVAPTGRANNALADQQGRQELGRFTRMFARDFCGDTRTKDDTAVTAEDIAGNNLILFGDPGSNQVLARIADQLPVKWTKDSITVGGQTYSAADHVPVLIYPNPLNPKHYVVINAGLSAQGFRGPAGYGDYAVLKLSKQADGTLAAETATEGVFDESWQLPAKL